MYQTLALIIAVLILLSNPPSLIQKYRLRNIPGIGHGIKDWLFIPTGTKGKLHRAYKKFSNTLYKMQALEGDVVLIPSKYLDELKSMPDSHFAFAQAQELSLMSKYTKTPVTDLVTTSMRNNVGPQAGKFIPAVYKVARTSLASHFPVTEEWKPVTIFPEVPHLIATTGGVLLSGEELNSHEEWANVCIDYLVNVFQGSSKLLLCPTFLRPLAQFFIPELSRIKSSLKKANKIAMPIIEKRLKNMENEDFQKPIDLIQWALDLSIQRGPVNLQEQVECQLMGALGAIHTTSMAFTQAIYDLAARPEYVEPLRHEIQDVLGDGHDVTKVTLSGLQKMDSFIKESQRLNGITLATSRRVTTQDIHLSTGHIIPSGTQTGLPGFDQLNDVPNPDVFDGFRYYRIRKESPENENKYQFVESGKKNLYWGYGRHACCGRFFASDELKCLLVCVLRGYDLKLPEGMERPNNWLIDWKIIPNIDAKIMMRKAA